MKVPRVAPVLLVVMLMLPASTRGDALTLTPSAALQVAHTDNLFFSQEDPVEDTVTTLTAGLDVSDRNEILAWHVSGQVKPYFYAENDDLDAMDEFYQARATYQASPRLHLNLDGAFTLTNRADRDLEDTGLVYDTDRRDTTQFSGNGHYVLSETADLTAAFSCEQNDWHTEDDEELDSQSGSLILNTSKNISRHIRQTSLIFQGGYSQFDYDSAAIQSGFASLGLQSRLSETLSVQADAGLRYTETEYEVSTSTLTASGIETTKETEKTVGRSGLGNLSLSYQGAATRVTVSASHDIRTASGSQGTANLSRASLQIWQRLLDHLTLGFSGSYYLNKADAGEYAENMVDQETIRIRPWLRYGFLDHWSLEGFYVYTRLQDHEADTTTERHRVALTLSVDWPIDLND